MTRKQPNIHHLTLILSDGTTHKLSGRRKDLIETMLRLLYPTGARDDIKLSPIIIQPK